MGYYTNFELSVHQGTADLEAVKTALDTTMGVETSLFDNDEEDAALVTTDSVKWYDHDEDCAEMSKRFPSVVFKLHGEGEEQGDLWEAYYSNGLCQICRALPPVFPPFDSTKLATVQVAQQSDKGRV